MTISIGFFGTPALAASVLSACFDTVDTHVRYVVTAPDKPVGRSGEAKPTPVKSLALSHGVPVFTPIRVRKNIELLETLRTMPVDYLVVVAYGKILPMEILTLPSRLPVNVHGSILPAYRWAAPIQAAIAAGETETGVTIMTMTEGMDEGDILAINQIPIDATDTSGTLFAKFAEVSGQLLVETLRHHSLGEVIPKPQDHSAATYTRKIEKEDGLLRYDTDPKTLHDRIRSLTPWPGAYDFFVGRQLRFDRTDTEFGSPIAPTGTVERIPHGDPGRIGIAVDGGWLILRSVTIEWKKTVPVADFTRGHPDFIWYCFDYADRRMEPLSRARP